MNKLLSGLLIIGVVAGVAIYSTNAFFSDTETSSANTFQAGKLDLKVDYSSTYNGKASNSWELTDLTNQKFFDIADVKPGDSGEGTISLHVDDNNSWGCVTIKPTANDDNGLTGPESKVDTTDGAGNGELAQNLQIRIWADICSVNAQPGDNVYQDGCDKLLTEGPGPINTVTWPLADSTHPNIFTNSGALQGNSTYYIGAGWSLPATVGNEVQSDSYKADISFYTEQERNNADFLCPSTEQKYSYFEDFNDGNLEKWELGGSLNQPSILGTWRIDNGAFLQDNPVDGVWAAIKDHEFSDVVVSSDIRQIWQSAGLGFLFWFQDSNNWAAVVATPGMQQVAISENVNGVGSSDSYPATTMQDGGGWYNVKAEIDSINSVVKVYVDGGLVATRTMATPLRTGKLGLITGNAGGWFDNFNLVQK